MTALLPWQAASWQRVCNQIADGKMPHGILLAGPPDSGKANFAAGLAAYLLCNGDEKPCGRCSQCHLVSASTHPDLLEVTLEDSKQIRIEQVRDLIHWANQTSQQGGYKTCIINPADKLNIQSANALLKVLEEPPPNTLICLVSDQATRLLPTLRSRCQRIDLGSPSEQEAIVWLQGQMEPSADIELLLGIAGGMPLRVLKTIDEDYLKLRQELASHLVPLSQGARSPIQVAALMAKEDAGRVLELLYQLVSDSIALTLSGEKVIKNRDLKETIKQYSIRTSVAHRYQLLDHISVAQGQLKGTSNANGQMLLEGVFVKAV
ncbi:MAG: DNA polymerase III subunit delta' [Candidatus Azotimanducaceae bacterium WSBS_2022_MAG_OTU7]